MKEKGKGKLQIVKLALQNGEREIHKDMLREIYFVKYNGN